MAKVLDEKVEEVLIITTQNVKIEMPNVKTAQSYATGLWKGKVKRIEIKSVIEYISTEQPKE